MTFVAGEKVICVDASRPANTWHQQHPLKWGGIYLVRAISPHDHSLINIDSSKRLWECARFRPFDRQTETDIGFAHEILRKATAPKRKQSALVPAMAADTTTAPELSDPPVAVVVNQSRRAA